MPKRYHEVVPGFWICDTRTRYNKNFLELHQFDKIIQINKLSMEQHSLDNFIRKVQKCLVRLQTILLWGDSHKLIRITKLFYQQFANLTMKGVERISNIQALQPELKIISTS